VKPSKKSASQIQLEWRTRCSEKHRQFHVQHSSVGCSVTLQVLVRVHPQPFRSVVQSLAIFCSADDVVIRRYQMTVFIIHAIRMKELNLTELQVNIQLEPRSKHIDPRF
jgi:hypothetical protein